MSASENSISVELIDATVNAWFAAVPGARDRVEHPRPLMRAAHAAVGLPAPAADDSRYAVPSLNGGLVEILGRPNFMCAALAALLRAGGHRIKNKAEHEQAAVIHFLLSYYLKHGSAWRELARSALDAIAAQISSSWSRHDGHEAISAPTKLHL
ncbi:hypothetical protein ACFY89_29030 [Achromobacter spanius]|uniref:hypothetical protein n=1 Tax=Achromobacter spanius TaxID=217203 RepID=UPI0036ED696F